MMVNLGAPARSRPTPGKLTAVELGRAANPSPAQRPQLAFVGLLVAAAFYNAVLAWLAARGMNIGRTMVAGTEALILAAALAAILATGRLRSDTSPVLLGAFFVAAALVVSLIAQTMYPDMARNAAIIALFLMLGSRTNEATIKAAVAATTLLVLAGLIVEIADPATYVWLFQPAHYYELTRGVTPLETMDGLFRNASGFGSRFVIADFLSHRASSLFLEQVSLGNFGIVLLIYLIGFWERHQLAAKLFYGTMVAVILVTTNSRMLLAFVLLTPLIWMTGPAFYRNQRMLILPALLLPALFLYVISAGTMADDLVGRVAKTVRSLAEMDVAALFGGRADLAHEFSDSGYTFVIYSGSILALLALWIFVGWIVPDSSQTQRRLGLALCLYVFLNLMVSGTSVFSIKAAALLWLIAGFVRADAEARQPITADHAQTKRPGRSKRGWRDSPPAAA